MLYFPASLFILTMLDDIVCSSVKFFSLDANFSF